MKVFISWSRPPSDMLAEILRDWLPSVIQAIEPYYSADLDKGARWNAEVTQALEESRVGLLCITKENISDPWILFEAGALSMRKPIARVCPILFGLRITDVSFPIAQFDMAVFEKEDIKRVL